MAERADPLVLGNDCVLAVVSLLDVQSALSLSACSTAWRQLVLHDERLWRQWAVRDLPPSLLRVAAAAAAAGHSWSAAYERAARMQSLRCVTWSGEVGQRDCSIAGRQPRPREGHAACSWGTRSMLVCGGFGGGILSGGDLHLLTPNKSSRARRSGSSRGGGVSRGTGGQGSRNGDLRWVQPKVSGRPPVHRYGHTLTRCGPAGEMAVLFGGLQAGGYQAPLDTLAVLRRKASPGAGGASSSSAGRAAGPAAPAAAAAASSDASNSDGAAIGREEDTSLALRLDGWQGGADGGGLQQLLWAQMFEFFMGQEDEDDDEEEEEEGEEEEGDSQGAASSDDGSYELEDGLGSQSGSEYRSLEDDGSDEEWLPSHDGSRPAAAAGATARPASVVTAMARRSSGPDSPAAAGGLHHPADSPSRASAGATGAGNAAGATARWSDEDALLAEEELEWFYPLVSGEAPGARGYHSAAVSEDGTKLYVFGGISAAGACDTLAVLDLTTWHWSRPHTHGKPPSPRCGHSSCVHGARLWVVGGGSGRDLLRSGRDKGSVYCLDLASMEWRRLPLASSPRCAGKCHASALVGRRLLLFGGSMATCDELAWLDLEQEQWGVPRVRGEEPLERMSATAVLCGEELIVFGGYTFGHREVGDLHRLLLLPPADG